MLTFSVMLLITGNRAGSQVSPEYKYIVGTTDPPAGWMEPEFDDSSWENGRYAIGYGDNDDSTLIDPTTTVYLRFNISLTEDNLDRIQALVLLTDFDDGYIAYLNGQEILRVNLDPSIPSPGFQQTTCRSHEAVNYTEVYRTLNGYYIDSLKLEECSLDTSNILAVQVHNDSINGSDLTFRLEYYFINNSFIYNLYWNECRFTNPLPLDSLQYPIVIIETDEFGLRYKDTTIAHMGIINNGQGNYNRPDDPFTDYDGRIRINQRGQTSSDFPKVSFRVETQDSLGDNNNVALLGMPEENDWILFGPFSDKSLIRNELIFGLGRKMGYYEPRTRFCEVILNGKDMGLYALTEKIKRDKNRVAVAELHPDENDSIDVTGGYLFKYDKQMYGQIEVIYPKPEEISLEQSQYIEGFLAGSEEAVYSQNFTDTESGFRKYIDDQSLIDYIIINELSKNIDSYYFSCYMYKDRDDRDGRIKYGPLWDYDFSLGYCIWYDIETTDWQFEERSFLSLSRILQDTSFVHDLAERWHSLREGFLNTDSIFQTIDQLVEDLTPGIERNYQIWPIIQYNYMSSYLLNEGYTYDEEIQKMKNWIEERTLWIDNNIDGIDYPVTNADVFPLTVEKNDEFLYCYPNPFRENIGIRLGIGEAATISFELRDISGRLCSPVVREKLEAGISDISLNIETRLLPGTYILYAYKNNRLFACQRIFRIL